jgi:hypothetical protein
MRSGLCGSLAALLSGASLALAQAPTPPGLPEAPALETADPSPALPDDAYAPARGRSTDDESLWVRAEYLLWWFKNSPVPVPLITTTSSPDLMPTAAFGQFGTSVLLGNQDLNTGARHGGRISAGLWLDDRRTIGLEAGYFFIASHTVTRGISSDGGTNSPILAVPFFDPDAVAESTFVIASPSTLAGSAELSLTSRLQGAEANFVVKVCSRGDLTFQLLNGFRYLELVENLSFATNSIDVETPDVSPNSGLVLNTLDQFNTRNQFYGWQIGARAEYRLGDLYVSASGKVAAGDTYQEVNFNGTTVTNFFNGPAGGPFNDVPTQAIPGTGTFVQATNLGRTTRHEFTFVPELSLSVGYQVTRSIRAFAGYDLLYFSNVVRPGDQIDRTITLAQTIQNQVAGNPPGPGVRPTPNLSNSEFWAQGINFGLEFRY